jgi:hypothetical protein
MHDNTHEITYFQVYYITVDTDDYTYQSKIMQAGKYVLR